MPTLAPRTNLDRAVAASVLATVALNLVVFAYQVQADPAAVHLPTAAERRA